MTGLREEARDAAARTAHRPLGQRRLTPAMLQAEGLHALNPMSGASKGQVIIALKQGGKILGVPRHLREFLVYLISRTFPCDWEPGATPIAAPSNRDIADELEIERTQIKAIARQAAELGLLTFRDSPTGRRWVRREGKDGPIIEGYGFDLSPLSRRYDELTAARAAHEERRREGERLRRDVTVTLTRILALAKCAGEMGVADVPLAALVTEATQLAQLRGTDRNPTHLSPIVDRLVVIRDTLDCRLALDFPVETDPEGSADRPLYTTTNQEASAYAGNTEGPSRPYAHEAKGSRDRDIPADKATTESPLRGFIASPAFLLMIAPILREFCPSSRPTTAQIVEAAAFATHPLGISPHA